MSLQNYTIYPGEGLFGRVIQERDLLLIDNPKDPRLNELSPIVPVECMMAVPMLHDGEIVGLICAVNNKRPENFFIQEQIIRFKFLAGQVVLADNILQAYSVLSERQRLNQELEFTRNLQRSLLPTEHPRWGNFTI